MKRIIAITVMLAALPAFAQAQTQTQAPSAPAPSGVERTGYVSTAVEQFDNNTNSSKFTEYRNIRDGLNLLNLGLDLFEPDSGLFLDFAGTNVSRRDQQLAFSVGEAGNWRADVAWTEVPHDLSNKAQTPYIVDAGGFYRLPQTMTIPFKKLATAAAPDVAGVLASDQVIASYARSFVHPFDLGNQTNRGGVWLRGGDPARIGFDVQYTHRSQTGNRDTYGPIGDRPPRTLNIEMAEPLDYRTNDIVFAAERDGGTYQARFEYMFSDFANQIDTLVWQNAYASPAAGTEFDVWDRLVAAYGARPLPPDNRYHNASANVGVEMPLDSRLMGTVAYGRLEQNEPLLPYANQPGPIAAAPLPRSTADARINTLHLAADYALTPVRRLNVRAFFRRYDMDNDTPSSQWYYVTSDTTNLNGGVSYVNKRVSLPWASDRQNAGAEATWRLPGRSGSLTVGYEREDITRDFREADTTENVLRAAWNARHGSWLSLRARYVLGARDGGVYHNEVTSEGYWYAPAEANDNNNPQFTFDNHPDMRRFDVSDRRRDLAEFTGTVTPSAGRISLSTTVRYRRDDFESDVAPEQPLLDTSFADRLATTPGDQLGLLRDARLQTTVDLFFAASERVSLNAFAGLDRGESRTRSLEFNENNKANPSAIATAELGPWTRAGNQWTSESVDRSVFLGGGCTLTLVPGRAALSLNYTASIGAIEIDYTGYGVTNWDGRPFPPNHQFFFETPPDIKQEMHAADVRLDLPLMTDVTFFVGYTLDSYRLRDWQQEESQPWVEPVGSEFLLRDTSRSFQWGNRLFNMGRYLAPSYTAHFGYVGFTYRF